MADTAIITPPKEEKKEETITPTIEKKPEEKTVGELLNKEGEHTTVESKVVPEAVFLQEKRDRKEAQKLVEDLRKQIAEGATKSEIHADIDEAATALGVDPVALKKYTDGIMKSVKEATAQEMQETLGPIKAKDRETKVNEIFTKHFNLAMEGMPEFKDIVDPEVIKTLSLDPKNAKKTFSEIIESTYGKAISGKRTIENKQPGHGRDSGEVDFDRAKKDGEYFKDVMKDPILKKKYNEGLTGRIGRAI